ncbi:MAG: fumarylacetoacetate hydrolase family protein [Bacteroidia bacterium]|nr:fumarylacetoacetate hydrolase family protein [Bacteroidia bacterium]MCO5253108.1 fumarylacetoacetate hydrolase family protein [Bacteroidota bacterium]
MKIFCVGRNYALHANELGNTIPESPVIFLKPETALLRKGQPFYIPAFSNDIHYEAEIVVRICRLGKGINVKFAQRYYKQITIGIDFTARDIQQKLKEKGLPWEISKGFDNSAGLGDWIDLTDFNIRNVDFSLNINDTRVQTGNTADMIFCVDEIIAYISQFYTLKIGDIIYTGTPAGVDKIKKGDRLTGYISDKKLLDIVIK